MTALPQGTWNIDTTHSEIGFIVRHAGVSKVRGQFTEFDSNVEVDSNNLITVNATIKSDSFNSRNEGRDQHVRSEDFLNVQEYPELTFKSTDVSRVDDEKYVVTGELTIRGVTQTVSFDAEFNGIAVDPFGNTRAGLEAKTVISRKKFGLTWNATLETGGVLVSDKVTIELDLSFILAS